jgi:hypothetical protein
MAVTILIHFHALSGFVFGCGINEKFMQLIQQMKDLNNIDNLDSNNNNNNHCSTITSREIDIIQNNNNNNIFINASNSVSYCFIECLTRMIFVCPRRSSQTTRRKRLKF